MRVDVVLAREARAALAHEPEAVRVAAGDATRGEDLLRALRQHRYQFTAVKNAHCCALRRAASAPGLERSRPAQVYYTLLPVRYTVLLRPSRPRPAGALEAAAP